MKMDSLEPELSVPTYVSQLQTKKTPKLYDKIWGLRLEDGALHYKKKH